MSVTYGDLLWRADRDLAAAAVALRQAPPTTPEEGRDLLAGYQDLLRAIARHLQMLLDQPLPREAGTNPPLDRSERATVALTAELGHLAQRRPLPSLSGTETNYWRTAAITIGAATDLVATHLGTAGAPRSPDAATIVAGRVMRLHEQAIMGDTAATALRHADELVRRVVASGVYPSYVRRRLADPITAEVLAGELRQNVGVCDLENLLELRTARPLIDTSHPLAELGDRMAHLRHLAWGAAQAKRPSMDDLKVFAVLGLAVNAHAEAFARRSVPAGQPLLLGDGDRGGALEPRSGLWRIIATRLQPWQMYERAHPGVVGHGRRVRALLSEVAPLDERQASAARVDAADVAAVLRGAVHMTDAIGGWNGATLDVLRHREITMPARALPGGRVTDDPTLATAKLAGARIAVPAGEFRDLQDVYTEISGRVSGRTGVVEPMLAPVVERAGGRLGLTIERP